MNPISVYVKNGGALASFYDSDEILLLVRADGKWSVSECLSLPAFDLSNQRELRAQLYALAAALSDKGCKTIAGAGMNGICFGILDRAGFAIFTIEALGDEML
ncbi:MAG: hypothetical protein LBC28_05655, partial [Oscillospiraceae bacterium]|nr:hypothetical protein [Oscillospiraceae bacterium]